MKESMSSIDIRAICTELNHLIGARVKKCYQPHYEQIVLRMNPRGADNFDLVLVRGQRIYTSQRERPMPMNPGQFAMLLRKNLANARLEAIEQLGFDRVARLTFDGKHGIIHLYVEMFRDGNLILCQEDGMIIQPLTHATYADRTLKKGHIYAPPPASKDPHELTVKDLSQILTNSEKNLVATLGAKEVLGGSLAKAVIADCEFDSKAKPQDVAAVPIHQSLEKILNSTEDGGFAHLKSTTELDLSIPSADRDTFIEKNCTAVWPIKMPIGVTESVFRFDTFSAAIDAWKGGLDSAALARREEELLDIAAPGRGHSTTVERLERRLAQQEKAISGFDSKGEGQQSLGHEIQNEWVHVDNLLNQVNQAIAEQGFTAVGKMVKSIEWISSINAAKRSIEAFLPDENGTPGTKVTLYLDDSVHQNASRYFTIGRKQKNKISGGEAALEETRAALASARKKQAKKEASGQLARIKRSRRLWFENHRWSILPGGHLMIGGKDVKGNDAIVKKHLKMGDRYLHADIHGAPSCALKSSTGFVVDERPPAHIPKGVPAFRLVDKIDSELDDEKTLQAATLALAWSRSWNAGGAHGTVFWVKPGQVSKQAESGESLGRGAFVVRGERTWYKDIDLKLGIGLVAINGIPLILASTVEQIRTLCSRHAIISPGRMKKETFANSIWHATGISTDDILGIIPGDVELIEDHGLIKTRDEK